MVRKIWPGALFQKIRRSERQWWLFQIALLLVGMIGISGCGPGDGRLAVSGSVTVDGVPLDGAAINFQAAPGTTGPSSGGPVQDGHYEISTNKGLLPGTYRVIIIAMKKTGRTINDPQKGRIPELVQVRFSKPPRQVTVTREETNEFQFDLTSAP